MRLSSILEEKIQERKKITGSCLYVDIYPSAPNFGRMGTHGGMRGGGGGG